VRQDRNSQYGNANTWLLGYGYALTEAWRATASYSTAFRAPTFNELYYPNFGDATLRPERSRNGEIGLHYAAARQHLDLVYFDNRTHDLIAYVALPAPRFFGPVNINQARVNGAELSYAGQFGDTGGKIALTVQDPRDERTGQRLLRRSQFHGSAGLTHQIGGWRLGAEWQHSGAREDSHTDPVTFATSRKALAGYDVFNVTLTYTVNQEVGLSLRADNLTDRNDTSAYGYNPLGRRLFAGISYQPKR
jgi:vitamin B12 transporter